MSDDPPRSIEPDREPTAAPTLVGRVVAVNAGRASVLSYGRRAVETAFVKTPLVGRVAVSTFGIAADEHVYEDHGGPDMALLAYPIEHYDHWRRSGIDLPDAAAMAENLTVEGLLETDVMLGDVFTVGSARVQITQPRSPCFKIAARYGRKDLPVQVQDTGFTGYLLRVLREGEIGAGDEMVLVERAGHGVTVAEAGRIANVDRNDLDGARRVLTVEALGSSVRRKLAARVASAEQLGLDTERLFLDDDTA
jgi:MOSC domain-containing protein YiiM